MNFPKLICPDNRTLLSKLQGHSVAVRVRDISRAARAASHVQEAGASLHCVILDSPVPLCDVMLGEEHRDLPIALYCPSMGCFRSLSRKIGMLREFNLRIYLACDKHENITSLRILSSLGVCCCAVMERGVSDWEALTDLMTYAILERTPHAPIEPFEHIELNYDPSLYLDWGRACFNDPAAFLHLDSGGRVSLSAAELKRKQFVADDLREIEDPAEFPAIKERLNQWRDFFVSDHLCASCEGWKVCLGKFADQAGREGGCSSFFREVIEVCRQRKTLCAPVEERPVWQP